MGGKVVGAIFLGVVGIICIIKGILAVKHKEITLSAPPEDSLGTDTSLTGRSATGCGWGFIVFGIFAELAVLWLFSPD